MLSKASAVSSVRQVVSGQIGNLAFAFKSSIYFNSSAIYPLWSAFLVEDYRTTVFGAAAAQYWGLQDGDEVPILFYDSSRREVNGYKVRVLVSSKFRNPFAIFLSWKETEKFFSIDTSVSPGILKARQPPLGNCVFVNYP
jgi:hypothetical protein